MSTFHTVSTILRGSHCHSTISRAGDKGQRGEETCFRAPGSLEAEPQLLNNCPTIEVVERPWEALGGISDSVPPLCDFRPPVAHH